MTDEAEMLGSLQSGALLTWALASSSAAMRCCALSRADSRRSTSWRAPFSSRLSFPWARWAARSCPSSEACSLLRASAAALARPSASLICRGSRALSGELAWHLMPSGS